MTKVLLFRGTGSYDALGYFTDDLAAGFRERGIETVIAHADALNTHQELAAFLEAAGPVDFAFSFFVFCDYKDPAGRSIAELIGAPFLVQHLDHPFVHAEALDNTAPSSAVLVVDPSHVDDIRSLMGPDRFAYVGFVPHAALGEPFAIQPDAESFAAGRPIQLLFTGTFYPPGATPWAGYPAEIKSVFDEAASLALSCEWMPALGALDAALVKRGIDPKAKLGAAQRRELNQVRMLAFQVNEWVRSTRRTLFIEAAARAGLPLTVYGRGFDVAADRFRNLDYKGVAGLAEINGLMRRSRAVMNINANFGRGTHDRPFTAMIAGAAAISDHSAYYAEHFDIGREMFLYRWTNLDADLEAVARLTGDPERLFEMAKAAQPKAMAQHRWANRIDDILAIVARLKRR